MRMAANICLSEEQMRLGGTPFESWLYRYLFPPIFAVGLIGNIVNLCVLLSPSMRNRANNLLSVLAFVDMAFLLAMLPHSLANYTDLAMNYQFRFAYLLSKLEVNWVANWLSAAAIWIVLAVCVDRNMGVKSPLYSRKDWASGRMAVLLVLICVFTGILTSYKFFGYQCFRTYFCDGTQIYSVCYSVASDMWVRNVTNPYPHAMREYVRVSTIANVLLVVVIPIITLIALNSTLLHDLRKRSKHPLLQHKYSVTDRNKRSSSTVSADRCQERKVAVTVCAIVGCFILTQGPSGVILVWHWTSGFTPATSSFFYNLRSAANFLVIVGKSTNFFLFCFCSRHFRQRLCRLCQRRKRAKTTLSANNFETAGFLGSLRNSFHDRKRFLTKSTTLRNVNVETKNERTLKLLNSRRMSRSLIFLKGSTTAKTTAVILTSRMECSE